MELLKNLFNHKKRPKIRRDHDKLKKQALAKLSYAVHKKNDAAFLNSLKEFYAEFFHIRHEFTSAEFLSAIKNKKVKKDVKSKLISLTNSIDEAYYSAEKVGKDKLKELYEATKQVILDL